MSFRYSSVSDYYKCPKYYELRHVLGVKPDVMGSSALKFGTAMHAAIEAMFNKESATDTFDAFWDSVKDKELQYYGGETWQSLKDDGLTLINKFEKGHLKHLVPTFLEQKLSGVIAGIGIEGTVDFAGLYKGVPSVVDFKTSGKPYEPEKLVINEQLYFYNHMLAQKHGFNATQHVYIVLRKKRWSQDASIQVLTKQVSKLDVEAMMVNVGLVCAEISSKSQFTKNRNSCMMGMYKCDMYSKCYGDK